MTAQPFCQTAVQARSGAVRACTTEAGLLSAGFAEAAELLVWNRRLPAGADAVMRAFLEAGGEDSRSIGGAGEIRAGIRGQMRAGGAEGRAMAIIGADVERWLGLAEALSPGNTYTLRIEHVADDACRKFHKDRTDLRLITTYAGRGTQWIETREDGVSPEVQEMAEGAVGLFLGHREGQAGRVLHRSPPLSETGGQRLVLVLDIERPGWLAHMLAE